MEPLPPPTPQALAPRLQAWLQGFSFKTTKMAATDDLIQNPAERVRSLVRFAGQMDIDNDIKPKKYFRSGVEMERMVCVSRLWKILLIKPPATCEGFATEIKREKYE